MQEFIAYGRVSSIPNGAYGKTAKGTSFFKFDFVCHSSQLDKDGKPIPSFFHVQVYGKQADVMYDSLSVGSPILLKGEIVQTTYKNDQGQNRFKMELPSWKVKKQLCNVNRFKLAKLLIFQMIQFQWT